MQIDTPNRTYRPVKPDRATVTPPATIKPVKDDKHQRDQPRKSGDSAAANKPVQTDDDKDTPSFDDFA